MAYSEKETFLPLNLQLMHYRTICKYTFFGCNVVQCVQNGISGTEDILEPDCQSSHCNRRLLTACEEVLKVNYVILTFRGPCIVIHSFYNKSQQDALFLKFVLVKNSTCFGQIYCPSSGVLILYSQQQVFVILVMLTVYQFHPDLASRQLT